MLVSFTNGCFVALEVDMDKWAFVCSIGHKNGLRQSHHVRVSIQSFMNVFVGNIVAFIL